MRDRNSGAANRAIATTQITASKQSGGKLMKKLMLGVALAVMTSATAHAETLGASFSLFDDVWLTGLRHGMQNYAQTLDKVNISFEDAQGDVSRQQNHVQNYVATGVDGIIVMLVDPSSGPALSKIAASAGVPLVFVNNAPLNLDRLPEKQAFVGSDDYEAGTLQAEAVCKMLGGKGKAMVMVGQLGTTGALSRTKAVHDVFSRDECKGIKIVEEQTANYMRTPAIDLMTNWLSAGREFDAVVANNDEMAVGAIQALKASGRSMESVVIAGVDATPDALNAVAAGDLDITVYQNAKGQGKGAIDSVLKLSKGEAVEKKTYVPFELVTKDNLAQYR
jgi:inositol transport system substrate-binding protein